MLSEPVCYLYESESTLRTSINKPNLPTMGGKNLTMWSQLAVPFILLNQETAHSRAKHWQPFYRIPQPNLQGH